MTTYSTDNVVVDEILAVVREVERLYHQELADAGVTYEILAAWPGENQIHAVMLHGWPCAATIKLNSTKDRIRGLPDVLLTVDANHWNEIDRPERLALIDHELTHLEPRREEGRFVVDDAGRPRIKLRPHDWQIGGFDVICQRHGRAAAELQACEAVVKGPIRKQLLLLFETDAELDFDYVPAKAGYGEDPPAAPPSTKTSRKKTAASSKK